MNTNEQAPQCCPFCAAGKTRHLPHIAFRWFECGTMTRADNNRRDQTPACAKAERERLTRERDEARAERDQALMLLGVYKTRSGDLLARVKQLESEWAGWPELQREWFGGKYAAMQPWDAVRARIEDSEARVQRLEEALEACAAIIGPRDKVTWATDKQVDHAWELYTKAKEAKP